MRILVIISSLFFLSCKEEVIIVDLKIDQAGKFQLKYRGVNPSDTYEVPFTDSDGQPMRIELKRNGSLVFRAEEVLEESSIEVSTTECLNLNYDGSWIKLEPGGTKKLRQKGD
jgi:hypothetical protein